MSLLVDPKFAEVYNICKDVIDNSCDDDPLLESAVETMVTTFKTLEKLTNIIGKNVADYDSKTGTKANGYRSLITVVRALVIHCVEMFETIKQDLSTFGCVSSKVRGDLHTLSSVLERLIEIVELAVEIKDSHDQLYPDEPDCQAAHVRRLTQKVKDMDVTPFYGSALGFHMRGDSRGMMHDLAICMASYSDIYGGSILGRIKSLRDSGYGWNYIIDPKIMAKRIVETSRNMQLDFMQSFYNMSEGTWISMVKTLPKIRTSTSKKLSFEALQVPRTNSDKKFHVPIPSSHINKKWVQVQLIANYRTKKMLGTCGCITRLTCTCKFPAPSDFLILHVHGGGFISQTSKAHLDYLHQWSTELNIPIISVDYSLAPEAPYPRALEEVFYVYCWVLNNFPALGTTGKKIILTGDSAGGNLVSSTTLKTIANHIRVPDALVLSYAALLIQFYPSPSRLLCLLDPLLMLGILIRCLNAYQDPNYLKTCPRSFNQELEQAKSVNDIFLSPLLAGKDLLQYFPRTEIIVSDLDPCLDENVEFSNKLSDAGVDVNMEVVPGLPHGFLAFSQLSSECQLGVEHVTSILKKLVKAL